MPGRSGVVVALLVLAAGGLVCWLRSEGDARADAVVMPARADAPPRRPPREDVPAGVERAPVASNVRAPAADAEFAPGADAPADPSGLASQLVQLVKRYDVQGRALDLLGAGVAGVVVRAAGRPDEELARTLGDGSFRFETRTASLELEARAAGWVTVRAGIVDRERAEREVLIVLAPAVALTGHVLDPEGHGIEGAQLALHQDWRGIAGFPLPLDDTEARHVETSTDAAGHFALAAVPRLPGRPLRVTKAGFEALELEVPAQDRELQLRLARSEAKETVDEPVVFGVVRFPDGAPAEGARVQIAQAFTHSDRDGRFELARPGWLLEGLMLVAMLDGWQPAVDVELARRLQDSSASVGPIELVLPGRALSIRGRLELADGKPAKGWSLRLIDPTVLDDTQTPAPTLENRGETDRAQGQTDAEGRFELENLSNRAYTIRLWQPKSFVSVESDPVPAGTQDLVLRVAEDALLDELTGRVTTRGGVPVEGAEVSLQFITMQTRTGFSWETPDSTRTDAQGEFALRKVPRRRVNVIVSGTDVVTKVHEPEGGELDGEPIELEVEQLFRVQLDFSSRRPPPDAFRMLDAAGEELSLETRSAHGRTSSNRMLLEQGRSGVVAVSELAATLVLMHENEESERRTLVLTPGKVNELRP